MSDIGPQQSSALDIIKHAIIHCDAPYSEQAYVTNPNFKAWVELTAQVLAAQVPLMVDAANMAGVGMQMRMEYMKTRMPPQLITDLPNLIRPEDLTNLRGAE